MEFHMHANIVVPEVTKDTQAKVTVSTWYKRPGEIFDVDEPLAELLFDKAAFDLSVPFKGRIVEIVVAENESRKVGEVLAIAEVVD
jgi:2-oxoglutarate dehydrogenase E2 component (dihydrolipoamide succinyltransferase)